MHEVLVNRLGGLSLPRKSVVRLTDRPDMTLDVYRGRKTTKQQQLSASDFYKLRSPIAQWVKRWSADLAAPGSILARDGNLFSRKRDSNAYSPLISPSRRPDMTETLLERTLNRSSSSLSGAVCVFPLNYVVFFSLISS